MCNNFITYENICQHLFFAQKKQERRELAFLLFLSFSHYLFINLPMRYLAKPLYFSAKPYTIWRNYRLLPNRIRFSLFSPITTTFSDRIMYLSAKNHNIPFLFIFSRHTIPETPDFCRKVYFCQIVSIATLTAVSKRQKKRGSPTTPVNPSKPEIP